MFDVKAYNKPDDIGGYSEHPVTFAECDEDAALELVTMCLRHNKPVVVVPHIDKAEADKDE